MTIIAVPFSPEPPEKLMAIVDKCQIHRPWFSDDAWMEGEVFRREQVIRRLADLDSKSWEVYDNDQLVGLLHADQIVKGQDARCHFLFFDSHLKDKTAICWETMKWMFEHFDLHALRVEVPTYANKLTGFARKGLGFRWETEGRKFSWPASATPLTANVAMLGSRRHHAIKYQGEWHDVLLLSVTRDEFTRNAPVRLKDGSFDWSNNQAIASPGT
jgi:hypothetical protein